MDEMSYSQIEGILYNYKLIKASIENNKLKLENLELEDPEGTMPSTSYGEPSSKTNKINRAVEDIVIRSIERKEMLKKKIAIDTNTVKMTDNALGALPEVEKRIIEMFYIENMEWWRIAAEVCYSEGWCKSKRKDALDRILCAINGNGMD